MITSFLIGFVIGCIIALPTGYQARKAYTRQLWRLSRAIRDRAKGLK
jgi:hypothetical protein